MYSMNNYQSQKNRGFTLIEMLIAVFIFTVAMSALTVMAGRGIRSANDSQERITANFLALEGIEVVRNIRDTAFIQNSRDTWNSVFGQQIFGSNGCFNAVGDSNQNKTCAFVYDNNGNPSLETCETCLVYLGSQGYENDPSTPGGSPSAFTRKIYLNQITADEVQVRVTVEWAEDRIEMQNNLLLWN